uniref:Phosphorylase b kinase regulatory subunit n=1 Tax=Panagrolaimus sp. JU765 TaxID=591449 RepID=A0AC34R2J9_9BILA
MRARTKSGVQLDQLMTIVEKTILVYQNPVTGLFENNADYPGHAWVRDNVYAAQALWAMYRTYRKNAEWDEDIAKANELSYTCIKIMQSLLECMMRQVDKVEQFKKNLRSIDCLHAKYSVQTKNPVVGDNQWGHLQIDAISLFLLTLAQMTASGLQIIRNFDEVAFVQNLVYYIEVGYRIPDYGIWERGDKTNQGICELNASSIGMAKAALQAINDVGDLFSDGSKGSIIHVIPDEVQQCSAVLSSMLPRESFSKETDAALLSVISYPAFAVEDPDLVQLTRLTVVDTLLGRYGCRRFLRDGYKTVLEDPNRLYYINAELQKFENIECEWPVFVCYLMLDSMFCGDEDGANEFWEQLQSIIVCNNENSKNEYIGLVPELYLVPREKVELERNEHGSQERVPGGVTPFLWAQSLYIICSLLRNRFLTPAEIDPLSRRLSVHERRTPCEVQVVILAETTNVQYDLEQNDIEVQLLSEVDPVFSILPATSFAKILARVGASEKLKLSGRPMDRDIGLLSTSKFYHLGEKFVVFTPQFMDRRRSHLMYDIRILMDEWTSELHYIYNSWNTTGISGRPLVVLVVSKNMLETDNATLAPSMLNRRQKSTVLGTIKKIKNGYIGGARVVMKNISDFFRTTAVSKLEFHDENIDDLFSAEALPKSLLDGATTPDAGNRSMTLKRVDSLRDRWQRQFTAVHRASMRHRSIVLDSNDADLAQLRLAYAKKMAPKEELKTVGENNVMEIKKDLTSTLKLSEHLHTSNSTASMSSGDSGVGNKFDKQAMEGMSAEDLVDMLMETTILDEQASIIHFLWMKLGPDFDTKLNGVNGVTVRILMEEIYLKACESRDWSWVRLTAGLLHKQLDELAKAATHLLVRQKQLTVGMPSKSEEAITCPKTKDELRDMFLRAYPGDPNSFTLAQEIIVSLGSLVRTDPRLFVEMFRIRIGLIIQILASELARIRHLSATEASQRLLAISPFEVKCMLFSLLSGRLLEDVTTGDETAGKELHTGMGSFRKQIEERKSLRKSLTGNENLSQKDTDDISDAEDLTDDFQFGIWLRHRRIDGALNRVPPEFYANLWDTVRLFPHGLAISRMILQRHLTQEMTRREIKFALEVEQVLNQISEPEFREVIVEVLTLMSHLEHLLMAAPKIPQDQPFEVDIVVYRANQLFVEHNRRLGTIVLECCGSGKPCDGARSICQHFYDTAPAGEFGTAHYIIKALMDIFGPI